MQRLYERWLKRDDWKSRSEALPLVVGVEPDRWRAYLNEYGLIEAELALWRLFAAGNGIRSDDDPVAASIVYEWFRRSGVDLPRCFVRLYDFVRQVKLRSDAPEVIALDGARPGAREDQSENEIVLGAALSLVASMPDRCRDEHGLIDGVAIAKLIIETAARWFPTTTPAMNQAQIAALIDRWLE
jgi:hypothetical protein